MTTAPTPKPRGRPPGGTPQSHRPESAVWYEYDGNSGGITPFRAADMPMDDQAAARKVSAWLDAGP